MKPVPLFRTLSLSVICCLVSCSEPVDETGTPRIIANKVNTLLDTVAQTELAYDPELASRLGLDEKTVGFQFNAFLTDRSQATYERIRVTRLEMMGALEDLPRPPDGSRLARDLDTVIAAYNTAESLSVFGSGETRLGYSYPYAADHMHGAYIDAVDLLTNVHTIETTRDLEAYVSRLSQLGDAIDDERRRLMADARSGVVPPKAILERMILLASGMKAPEARQHVLYTTLENLMFGVDDISTDKANELLVAAETALNSQVFPAYEELGESLQTLLTSAPEAPGVWQIPKGSDYYRTALSAYTMAKSDPAAIHQLGHDEVIRLTAELDQALLDVGLIEGSVTDRLRTLSAFEGQTYEDSPEGREALLARMRNLTERASLAIQDELETPVKTPVIIRDVPDYLANATPSASYTAARADGSAPGIFSINLKAVADWPDYTLPTLVFHETIPGHHIEAAVTAERANLPLIRQMIWNAAYGEGWGVYAETLADDLGLYEDDPYGRIGYLQSKLLRAARLVADTGLHQERWSRQTTIDYLVSVTGQSPDAMADEVDRYTVWPGQAAAYWIGHQMILDLRKQTELVLGPEFDRAEFHEMILSGGPRPLDILERDVNRWYTSKLPPPTQLN